MQNLTEMDHRPKVQSENYKIYRRKPMQNISETLDQAKISQDTKSHIKENLINWTTTKLKTFPLQRHH